MAIYLLLALLVLLGGAVGLGLTPDSSDQDYTLGRLFRPSPAQLPAAPTDDESAQPTSQT